jgi:Methyltransferase domain
VGWVGNGLPFGVFMSLDSGVFACPVCHCSTRFFYQDKRRSYYHCAECGAAHVAQKDHLCDELEKAEYDKHENNIDDEGYRRFLTRMLDPVIAHVDSSAKGLDFGCGPGPALAQMFSERGFEMSVYDKYYADDQAVFETCYDFVTTTEVVEHLKSPMLELERLWSLLKPQGCLGVMTKRLKELDSFASWHYKNDPTHIVFFHEKTFAWIAKKLNAQLSIESADVVLLTKKSA